MAKLVATEDPDIAMADDILFYIGPLSQADKADKLYPFDEEESIFLEQTEKRGINPDLSESQRVRLLAQEIEDGKIQKGKK